jgi:hypothetical protein
MSGANAMMTDEHSCLLHLTYVPFGSVYVITGFSPERSMHLISLEVWIGVLQSWVLEIHVIDLVQPDKGSHDIGSKVLEDVKLSRVS